MFIDAFFDYLFAFLSLACATLAFVTTIRFSKTKQFLPWIIILTSFLLDFGANVLWIDAVNVYGGPDNVPYPSFLDIMWLLSYLLFGLGVLIYWLKLSRIIKIEKLTETLTIIIALTAISFIVAIPTLGAFGILYSPVIDGLYVALPLFASLSCIPLIKLFKSGSLSRQWLYIAVGGIFYMASETLWVIEEASNANHLISNLSWTGGYILFTTALIGLVRLRKS